MNNDLFEFINKAFYKFIIATWCSDVHIHYQMTALGTLVYIISHTYVSVCVYVCMTGRER